MRIRTIASLFLTVVLCSTAAFGASGDDVVGTWNNQDKDARIDVHKCGEAYCGTIVWLKDPNYPEGSKDGIPGSPKVDHNNPVAELKAARILGLQIMTGFQYAGENRWKDGKVYDPKNGKTYSGKMELVAADKLELRGFIGISLLGRTTTWTRVAANSAP